MGNSPKTHLFDVAIPRSIPETNSNVRNTRFNATPERSSTNPSYFLMEQVLYVGSYLNFARADNRKEFLYEFLPFFSWYHLFIYARENLNILMLSERDCLNVEFAEFFFDFRLG